MATAEHDTAGRLHLRTVVPFLPPQSVPVAELAAEIGMPPREGRVLSRVLGLDQVYRARHQTVLDMMLAAGEEALAGTDRAGLRYIVHAHSMQHIAPPQLRWMDVLRVKLGADRTQAFSMSHLSCTTGLYALTVLTAMLRADPDGATALLLSGEKVISPVIAHLPKTTLLSDAASATVVGLGGPGDAVLHVAHRTLGRYYRSRDMPEELQREYRDRYVPTLVSIIDEAVTGAGFELDDIAMILPHNVNRFSWMAASRLMNFPIERIYLENVPRMAHGYSADPFINLATARAESTVRPGDLALLVSAGQGATFGAAVLRLSDLED